MPFRKLFLSTAFLLLVAAPLQAQWGAGSQNPRIRDSSRTCSGIFMEVKDSRGRAIGSAEIVEKDSGMRHATDILGAVSVPCGSFPGIMRTMEVHASGYKSATVSLVPDMQTRLEVILTEQNPLPQNSMFAVDVQDLTKPAQQTSKHLLALAAEALERHNPNAAEKAYLEALRTAQSDASIPNNLGVLALRRNDLEAANTWFEMALQINPYKAEYETNLGILRWMQGRREESYDLLVQAAERGHEPDSSHYIQGVVCLEIGLFQEAARHLKEVSGDRFPYRDLFLSSALRNLGKTKSADAMFRDYLKRNPFPFAIMPPLAHSAGARTLENSANAETLTPLRTDAVRNP